MLRGIDSTTYYNLSMLRGIDFTTYYNLQLKYVKGYNIIQLKILKHTTT